MELNFQPFPVDLAELARAILDGAEGHEEVVELIKTIDSLAADWNFTGVVAGYFQAELRKYGEELNEAEEEEKVRAQMRQAEMTQLGTLDDRTAVIWGGMDAPTEVDPL